MSFCFFAHVVCPFIHLFFLFVRKAAEQHRRRRQRIVTASYEPTTTNLLELTEHVHGQVTLLAHERKLRWKDNLASIGILSVTHTFLSLIETRSSLVRPTLIRPPPQVTSFWGFCTSFSRAYTQTVPAYWTQHAGALPFSSWSSYSVPWDDAHGFHVAVRTTHPLNRLNKPPALNAPQMRQKQMPSRPSVGCRG